MKPHFFLKKTEGTITKKIRLSKLNYYQHDTRLLSALGCSLLKNPSGMGFR